MESPQPSVPQRLTAGLVTPHVFLGLMVAIRAQLGEHRRLLGPLVLDLAAKVESVVIHLEVLLLVYQLLVPDDAVGRRRHDHRQVGPQLGRLDDVQAHPVGEALVRLLVRKKQNMFRKSVIGLYRDVWNATIT